MILESDGDQLGCCVRREGFRPAFGRVALRQLTPLLAESENGLGLIVGGRHHPIRETVLPTPSASVTRPASAPTRGEARGRSSAPPRPD